MPLLLVPEGWRPFAVAAGTLSGYAGEFSGPPLTGALKDGLAPLCSTVDVGGKSVLNPQCAASAADQRGLSEVILLPAALAVAASLLWMGAGRLMVPSQWPWAALRSRKAIPPALAPSRHSTTPQVGGCATDGDQNNL